MKINEVEAAVGVTKKNIRFYEAEGLLTPRRNSANGYRDYGDEDVAVLRRIKLMRKLGLPLEDIRQMLSGAHTVGDGMRRHLVTLERAQQPQQLAAPQGGGVLIPALPLPRLALAPRPLASLGLAQAHVPPLLAAQGPHSAHLQAAPGSSVVLLALPVPALLVHPRCQ